MRPLRHRLDEASKITGRRLDTIQQDYVLSWILWGLSQHPELKSSLIFKGGTALKKCYFGDYRFSEDLDFSATNDLAQGEQLFTVLREAILKTESKIREYADLQLFINRYEEKEAHPHGQVAFQVRAQFPWQREPLTAIMLEISREELVLLPPNSCPLIHEYGEPLGSNIVVYSLEEVVLEKLRAILQHTKKSHERQWTRSRARDYYDLWCIFNKFEIDTSNFTSLLERKCSHRGVQFQDENCFFNPKMIESVKDTWHQWLGLLVPSLPDCDLLLKELRMRIAALLT